MLHGKIQWILKLLLESSVCHDTCILTNQVSGPLWRGAALQRGGCRSRSHTQRQCGRERESSRGEGPGILLNNDTICCHYKTLRLTVNEFCVARSEGWLTSVAGTALCTHRTVRFICSLGLQEESLSESLCICVGPQGRGK